MTKKEKVTIILELLHEHYGPTKCYLDHENAWQLLIATMLSAQCTDARVNVVVEDLYAKHRQTLRNWSRIFTRQAFIIIRRRISLPAVRSFCRTIMERFPRISSS